MSRLRSLVVGFSAALGVLPAGLGLAPSAAIADGYAKAGPEATWEKSWLSVSTSLGVMRGEANEFVYDPTNGRTVSRLIWKFDNDVVLKGGVAVKPMHWLTLGVMGRVKLTDPSTMDDFDYNVPGCPPAAGGGTLCHSHHDNTHLRKANMVDLYAASTFYRTHGWSFSGLLGYKWEDYKWQAYGGTANYGVLPPGLGITYEQWWEAPYIGLQAKGEWGPWSLGGRVIGSWWVDSHDRDNHHLRTLLFTEQFGRSDMVGANIQAGYKIHPNAIITLGYDYQDWGLTKGPTRVTNYTTNVTAVIPGNAAGADNSSHTIALGFTYKFGEACCAGPLK